MQTLPLVSRPVRIVLHHILFPPDEFVGERTLYYYEEASPRRWELLQKVFLRLKITDGLRILRLDRLESTDHVVRPWYAPSVHHIETVIPRPPGLKSHRFFSHFFQQLEPLVGEPCAYVFRSELFQSFKRTVETLYNYESGRKAGLGGTNMSFWFSMNALDLQGCIAWLQERKIEEDLLRQVCWLLHCRLNVDNSEYRLDPPTLEKAERWAAGQMAVRDIVTPVAEKEKLVHLCNTFSKSAKLGVMTNAHRLVMSQVLLVHMEVPWWYGAHVWRKLNLDSEPAANGYNWLLQARSRFIKKYATLKRLEMLPDILPTDYGLSR